MNKPYDFLIKQAIPAKHISQAPRVWSYLTRGLRVITIDPGGDFSRIHRRADKSTGVRSWLLRNIGRNREYGGAYDLLRPVLRINHEAATGDLNTLESFFDVYVGG